MLAVRHKCKKSSSYINSNTGKKMIKKFYPLVNDTTPLVLANIAIAMPAQASGKVFDFNATLPAMATQFLLLMVFLDKTWFGPVGGLLDDRDAKIQTRLSSVKTGDEELENLAQEAEMLLKAARTEAQNRVADAKSKAASKAEAEIEAEKTKLDSEFAKSMKELESEKIESQRNVDKQVTELSAFIISKILPSGFSL